MANLTAAARWIAKDSPSGGYDATSRITIANAVQLQEGSYVQFNSSGQLELYSYDTAGADGGVVLGYVLPTPQDTTSNGYPAPYLLGNTSLSPAVNAVVFKGSEEQQNVAVTGLTSASQVSDFVYLPLQDNAFTLTSGGAAGGSGITGQSVVLVASAGNINTGAHTWVITANTQRGEIPVVVGTLTATSGSAGQATVTLPTLLPVGATSINIYRTKAGVTFAASTALLLTSIQVTAQVAGAPTYTSSVTTYTDNTADSGLTTAFAGGPSNGFPVGEVTAFVSTGFGNVRLWSYEQRLEFAKA